MSPCDTRTCLPQGTCCAKVGGTRPPQRHSLPGRGPAAGGRGSAPRCPLRGHPSAGGFAVARGLLISVIAAPCGQLASVATQSRADARRCSLQNGRNPRTPKQRQDLHPGAPASGRRVPPASSLRHRCTWTPCPRPSWRRRAHSSLFPAVSAEAQAFPSPTGLCHPRTPPSAVPGPPGATAPTTRVCGGGFSSPTRLGSR